MKKRVVSMVLALVMLCSLTVSAWAEDPIVASGQCGDSSTSTESKIQWVLWNTGKLVLSGEGHMENYTYYRSAPWAEYKEQITEVVIYGLQDELQSCVLSIGAWAFSGCVNLTTVTIPETVAVIGSYAFSGCENLKEITLPESLTSIGDGTFSGCENLKEVTLPESLTSIGRDAFSKSGLTSIEIPDSVTTIGIAAFAECPNLEYAKMPRNLETIEMSTFSKCSKLQNIIFSENLREIGYMAFMWCDVLQNFSLPESLEIINTQAFIDCENLTEVTIPAKVTEIGRNSFSGCGKLEAIYVAEDNSAYQSVDGVLMSKDGTLVHTCPGAKEGVFVIPDGATTIESCCFFDCQKLIGLVIPDTLTTVKDRGFAWCENLMSYCYKGPAPESFKNMDISYGATIYYLEGQPGWTSPTYLGYKTALWDGGSLIPGTLLDGDTNGDSKVDATDLQQLYGYLTGQVTLGMAQKMAADYNGDGMVDVYDLQALYEHLALQGTAQ